ncbi:hypothetical protein [Gorillibacterium sp. sgz5001074]|uniref:hypothetical protein n=1 Tax=Gorillibacterium sp. sgz5001074 TaxID=3446695 RepID=UPI003F6795D5
MAEPAGIDWERVLFRYKGWKMKLQIEDASGAHQTQVRYHTLERVLLTEPGELRLYLNEVQFLAVPLFEGELTGHRSTPEGGQFYSKDMSRDLVYRIDFYP